MIYSKERTFDAFWKLILKYCYELSEHEFAYSENWLRLKTILPVHFLFKIGYFDRISPNK